MLTSDSVVAKAVKKKARVEHLTASDKIDQIVTNRILALPIFAAVMYLIYSIVRGHPFDAWSIGTLATDWTNDVLFGEMRSRMQWTALLESHRRRLAGCTA